MLGEKRKPFVLKKAFLLSRYPVTNSQYALFIDKGCYENPKFWSKDGLTWLRKAKVKEPRLWKSAKWNAPNQPVVGVSFWEAEAFCTWAGGRLPTAVEWEAAARGPEGYEYPWGNDWEDGICNTCTNYDAGLGVTSPVGLLPRSRSRLNGLEDMAGNVFEWCADRYELNLGVGRVLRGGSWNLYKSPAKSSASGDRFLPEVRNDKVGFRVFWIGVTTK